MSDFIIYGIGALLICFTISTFFLTRIRTDIIPEEYEFNLDPFWYLIAIITFTAPIIYFIFPSKLDLIQNYNLIDYLLPCIFSMIIYLAYIIGFTIITNIITFIFALIISYYTIDDFVLLPEYLSPWQDKILIATIIFAISKGLGYLNGMGAISSIQFIIVMLVFITLTYFNIMPEILGVIALGYCGTMLAFLFLSWPPEKLVLNTGAFDAIGFFMACFMLKGATELNETSMLISVIYIFVEIGIVFYNKHICNIKISPNYKNTSYYKISEDTKYELETIKGIIKIFIINFILAIIQTRANERLSIPLFAACLNLWLLSILSGNSQNIQVFSLTQMGAKTVKKIINKSKNKT